SVPLPELGADRFKNPDRLEADATVQRDTCVVGQRNSRIRAAVAFPRELVEELCVERATDPLAVPARIHVRGNLGRPPVRRAFAVQTAVRVADGSTLAL